MDSRESHILFETYGSPILPETLLHDFDMGPIDMCDETQSVSSITSIAAEEKMSHVHTRWGSTCSSPAGSESLSSLGFADEFSLAEESFWGPDDSIRVVKREFAESQQNQAFEVANPGLAIPDRAFINETILQDPELIRAMDRVCELIVNPRPCINYGSSVERNEVSLAPLPANGSLFNTIPCDNSNGISAGMSVFNRFLEGNQMLQTIKEPIPEQKPSLLTHEIKEEVKTVNVEIPASKTRRKPKASTPEPKRTKRKYVKKNTERRTIQLYEFMLRLLDEKDDSVMWVSREEGVFKLLKSKGVAKLWGKYKKNDNMSYESLSRALRHYYALDILNPVPKKLHYKFCKGTLDKWYKGNASC